MILAIQTDEDCPAAPAIRDASASIDDLVAICRAVGVGTGLLRACQLRAIAPHLGPDEAGTGSCRVGNADQKRSIACLEANGFSV
jgi:hypothetical protein